jgi:dihydroorotate dehydrogenase
LALKTQSIRLQKYSRYQARECFEIAAAAHLISLRVNISMNRTTQPERMVNDYMICMEELWEFADYITLNLGVRAGPDLHQPEYRAHTVRRTGSGQG